VFALCLHSRVPCALALHRGRHPIGIAVGIAKIIKSLRVYGTHFRIKVYGRIRRSSIAKLGNYILDSLTAFRLVFCSEVKLMSRSTISTFQLFKQFPDEESARKYLESRLWKDGVRCPLCKKGERITPRKSGF